MVRSDVITERGEWTASVCIQVRTSAAFLVGDPDPAPATTAQPDIGTKAGGRPLASSSAPSSWKGL